MMLDLNTNLCAATSSNTFGSYSAFYTSELSEVRALRQAITPCHRSKDFKLEEVHQL